MYTKRKNNVCIHVQCLQGRESEAASADLEGIPALWTTRVTAPRGIWCCSAPLVNLNTNLGICAPPPPLILDSQGVGVLVGNVFEGAVCWVGCLESTR